MLHRRSVIAGALALAFSVGAAYAQDYKTQYPELVFAKVPDENASGTLDRWTPLVNYLSKELGVKVTLRIANDYAAVVEGQRAGNIHIAMYGPASYARAFITGAQDRAVCDRGERRRHEGLLLRALCQKGRPLQERAGPERQESLPGRSELDVRQQCAALSPCTRWGSIPRSSSARSFTPGSHENAVIGVQQGTCDAAFNWWNDEKEFQSAADGSARA